MAKNPDPSPVPVVFAPLERLVAVAETSSQAPSQSTDLPEAIKNQVADYRGLLTIFCHPAPSSVTTPSTGAQRPWGPGYSSDTHHPGYSDQGSQAYR